MPDPSFEDSIPLRLRKAYLMMHRAAQTHFSEFGATADQFVLLSLLAEEDGITQTELAQRMCSDANTVTAMLKLLEEKGCVRRRRCTTDGRARRVSLTASGKRLERKLHRSSASLRDSVERAVTGRDRKRFNASLDRIAEAIAPESANDQKAG